MDVVVFATPPHVTRDLLTRIPRHWITAGILGRLEYFPTEISIHRDPVYMPASPWHWSANNPTARADTASCRCGTARCARAAVGVQELGERADARAAREARPARIPAPARHRRMYH